MLTVPEESIATNCQTYGIDYDGPLTDIETDNNVVVPESHQMQELQNRIDPLSDDGNNGINHFLDTVTIMKDFLQFYQVTSAIPKYLVTKARNTEPPQNGLYTRNNFLFQLDASTQIQLEKAKTRDFYCLLNRKTHTVSQTGPMKWNSIIGLDENA